jgi:hypothetical protein
MLRFKILHQSGPAKILCKQKGSGIAEPPAYIPGQTGQGIIEPPAYIPGQTGGKGSKKAKPVRQKQKPPPKPPKPVKLDPNVNFSNFGWRKDYFGTISSYGGTNYEADIKAKTKELLNYLKEQPAQLMKDQKIDGIIKEAIDEIEEALLSGKYDDIETAFTNATDDLNDPTGRLANKQFVDIKVKKEKVKAEPKTAEQKKADREARKDLPKRELSETQKARMTLKGDDRIINQYKNALGEKKWYLQEAQNKRTGRQGLFSLQKQLSTGKTWTGLPIDDKSMEKLPAKIAAKQKEIDDLLNEWKTKRKPIYEKYKEAYEEILGHKVDEKIVLKNMNIGKEQKGTEIDKEDTTKLKTKSIKEIKAIPEPPEPPKRKAPKPGPEPKEYVGEFDDLTECNMEVDELKADVSELTAEVERLKQINAELQNRQPEQKDDRIINNPQIQSMITQLERNNVKWLRAEAKSIKVVGYSKMNKDELTTAIALHRVKAKPSRSEPDKIDISRLS